VLRFFLLLKTTSNYINSERPSQNTLLQSTTEPKETTLLQTRRCT